MWDSAFCGAGINIPPVIVEMKNLMKDLKGLLGEFRGWPTVELFSVRLAGLPAEDRERHLLGFCKLAFGHYEELPTVWYLTRHTPWKNARYELHRPDLFLRMAKLVEFTDRDGRLPYSHLAACLCMAFFVRSLSDPNSEVLPKSLASRLSALNILPSDILELAGKREITDGM